MQPLHKQVHRSVLDIYTGLQILSLGGIRSLKRGGLPIEVSLYSKCILHEEKWSLKRVTTVITWEVMSYLWGVVTSGV